MRIANSIIMCNSGGVLAPSLWRPSEDDDPGCFSLLSIQFPECLLKVSAAVNEDKQSLNLCKDHSCFAGINIIPSLSIHHPRMPPRAPRAVAPCTKHTFGGGSGAPDDCPERDLAQLLVPELFTPACCPFLLTCGLSALFTEENKPGLHFILLRPL